MYVYMYVCMYVCVCVCVTVTDEVHFIMYAEYYNVCSSFEKLFVYSENNFKTNHLSRI
jgi:hypothetical protein